MVTFYNGQTAKICLDCYPIFREVNNNLMVKDYHQKLKDIRDGKPPRKKMTKKQIKQIDAEIEKEFGKKLIDEIKNEA